MTESGYVHLVRDEVQIDEKSMLSVVVGSRITSLSRVHLMQLIRETSNGNVEKNFIYCDTDSVHTLCEYNNCDDKELGKLKKQYLDWFLVQSMKILLIQHCFESTLDVSHKEFLFVPYLDFSKL